MGEDLLQRTPQVAVAVAVAVEVEVEVVAAAVVQDLGLVKAVVPRHPTVVGYLKLVAV